MNAVQATHLRTFANAFAWAIQAKVDFAATNASHLQGLLGKLEKSVQASGFLAAPIPAAPSLQTQAQPKPASDFAKPPVQTEQSTVQAGRFFHQVPWGGKTISREPSKALVLSTSADADVAQANAVDFFASLSWGKARDGKAAHLSIGTSSDDPARAKALATRLGQSERPDSLLNSLPPVTSSAAGFFAKIPWRGQVA